MLGATSTIPTEGSYLFVDKVLICGALIALLRFDACERLLHGWMVVLVVARELLVTTIRGFAESQGVAFPADRLGKLKMVVQSVTAAAGNHHGRIGTDPLTASTASQKTC